MSFSVLVQKSLNDAYTSLPSIVGMASVSAGISYLASRATTRVSLPNPLVAAKFTAAIALVKVIAKTFENVLSRDTLSYYAVLGSGIFGATALLNTDGTIKTAAKLGTLTYGSQWLYDNLLSSYARKIFNKFSDPTKFNFKRDTSLNNVAFESLKKIYKELPQTIIATIATGIVCRSASFIGLNPKTAMTFTVATAALRGANVFIEYYCTSDVKGNNLTNTILMSGLTVGAKYYTHLKIPGYATIGKGYGIALLAIESSGLLIPYIKKFV